MDVVGYTEDGEAVYGDDDVDGDVMGSVMGRGHARRGGGGKHRLARIAPKPHWRAQLAPGVIQPDEGMVPLPLQPLALGGIYNSSLSIITFQGQLQKPFRGERLLVSTVRTGATAVGRLLTQFFIGTDLMQADIQGWDAELIGNPNSFGTRLTMKAAEPGVLIRAIVTLSNNLTGTDTIFANFTLLGRIVH
jgi:hypothetical protein